MHRMFSIFVGVLLLSLLTGCSTTPAEEPLSYNTSRIIEISVLESGIILADGTEVSIDELDSRLAAVEQDNGVVLYYRESPLHELPAEFSQVVSLLYAHGLPLSMSTTPDFTDIVANDGSVQERQPGAPLPASCVSPVSEYQWPSSTPTSQLYQQMCFIADLTLEEQGYVATVDLVVWLTGDDALTASGGDAPDGYHILNENEGRWIIPVAGDARVVLLEGASHAPPVSLSALATAFSNEPGEYRGKAASPYTITIRDDVITEIQEQYRP